MSTALALVSRYWQFAVIAALGLYIGLQRVQLADAHLDTSLVRSELSQERTARERERGQRLDLALAYELKLGQKERDHAAAQQIQTEAFTATRLALERRIADRDQRIGVQSARIAQFTAAGGRQDGDTDAVAFQRCADRLQALGTLVDRGQGVVERGVSALESRDAEVVVLKNQIDLDRSACAAQ